MAKRIKKRVSKKAAPKDRDIWLYVVILLLCAAIVWVIARKDEGTVEPLEETVHKTGDFDLDKIASALEEKFDLPKENIKQKKVRGVMQMEIPIERRKMDLTFANFIVKGEFESRGAELETGKVDGNRQELTFSHAGEDYLVKLSYATLSSQERTAKKYLSIVVDDFGSIGGDHLQEWLELPVQLSFAIIAGQKQSEETMNRAHAQQRVTMVHVPMEPIGYPRQNPGNKPILVQMDQSRVEKTLLHHLNALPLCAGANNYMGSLATTDQTIMSWVMDVLKKKGKFFLDSRTSSVSIAYQMAQKARIPAYRNDLFLDHPNISDATLQNKLNQVQELALRKNTVIAIIHCDDADKLQYLKTFIRRAQAAGFSLIPITQVGKTDVPLIL